MEIWSYDEEYICSKMYFDYYIFKKEKNCKEKLIDEVSLKINRSKESISKRLAGISYILDSMNIYKNEEIEPIKEVYLRSCFSVLAVLLENKIPFENKMFTKLINKECIEEILMEEVDIRDYAFYGKGVDKDNIKYLKWENVVAFRAATYGAMGSPGEISLCCSDFDNNYDIYRINPRPGREVDEYFVENTFKPYYTQLDEGLGGTLDNGRFLAIYEGMGNYSYIRKEYYDEYCEFCLKLGVSVNKETKSGSSAYYNYATACMLFFFNKKYKFLKYKVLNLPSNYGSRYFKFL